MVILLNNLPCGFLGAKKNAVAEEPAGNDMSSRAGVAAE
jgi:hypothetical protein